MDVKNSDKSVNFAEKPDVIEPKKDCWMVFKTLISEKGDEVVITIFVDRPGGNMIKSEHRFDRNNLNLFIDYYDGNPFCDPILVKCAPVNYMASLGSVDAVNYFLERRVCLYHVDEGNGNNLLHNAVMSRNEGVVDIVLNSGFNKINDKNDIKETPLFKAAVIGDLEIVKLLIRGGAYVDTDNFRSRKIYGTFASYEVGMNILYPVARDGNIEMVKFLLENGATPFASHDWGPTNRTPILDDGDIKPEIKNLIMEYQKRRRELWKK